MLRPSKTLVIITVVWVALLIGGSLLPFEAKAHLHTFAHARGLFNFDFHRVLHMAAFGFTAALALALSRKWLLPVVLCLTLAILTEYMEWKVYPNAKGIEWADVRDDAIGIGLAVLIRTIFCRYGSSVRDPIR